MRDNRITSGRVPTMVITLSMESILNEIERQQQLLYLLDVKSFGIVRGVIFTA